MTSTSIDFGQTKLSYYTTGEGFPLLLLHGFCADHSVWLQEPNGNDFMKPFTENYRLIMPDIPGFGTSGLGDSMKMNDESLFKEGASHPFASMDYYADCIKAILDAEKITSCPMIGHSMGGYILMNFASRFPGYLTGLGLFHSTAYNDDIEKKAGRTKTALFVKQHGVGPFVKELYGNLFGEAYRRTHQQTINVIITDATAASTTEGIINACIAMRDRKNTAAVLRQTAVPVLFVIGKEDKAIAAEKTLQLTSLPERSVICLLEKTGHMGMFEAPQECRAAILEWLSVITR